jgi:hypothetical protein
MVRSSLDLYVSWALTNRLGGSQGQEVRRHGQPEP